MTSTATEVPLRSYRPRPRLTLPGHPRPAARFPTVDAHSHPGRWLNGRVGREGEWLVPDVANFLDAMTHSDEDPSLMSLVRTDDDGRALADFCRRPVRAADSNLPPFVPPTKPGNMALAVKYLREGGPSVLAERVAGRLKRVSTQRAPRKTP